VNNDIVSKNYVKSVQIGEKIEKTGSIFTDDEIRILWQNAELEYVQDVLIMIYTGMRIGEAIAITSKTVNLEERYMIGGSKTEAGRDRVIPIHKAILPIVTERMERGKYLLYKQDGGCPSYSAMKHRFETLMAKLNMDHRWHDTRKTAVSIMHSAKIPMEIIRMIVGHSGKGVTETVYLYKEPHELVEAIDLIKVDV
jgi:integrase